MPHRFAIAATEPAPRTAAGAWARVWLLRTPAWREGWASLRPLVDRAAWLRYAGMRDHQRQQDRLLANALHRLVVADALGWIPDQLPLYRSGSGQPRLALPGWHTSLSHADDVIAIALCAGGAVGVDIERRSTATLQPIADLVCTAAELETLRAGADADRALLATWVRKEAALKAVGLGLSQPMNSFAAQDGAHLVLRDGRGAAVPLQVREIANVEECVLGAAVPPGAVLHWQWLEPRN